MAFPITFLDAQDIGSEVLVTLRGPVNVTFKSKLTGIHIITGADGELEVSIDTTERKDLLLQPDSYVFITDEVARV